MAKRKPPRQPAVHLFTLKNGIAIYGGLHGALYTVRPGQSTDWLLIDGSIVAHEIKEGQTVPNGVVLTRYNTGASFFSLGFQAKEKPPTWWWLCSRSLLKG